MFRRSKSELATGTAEGSPGKRAYVIGDVHGRLDLLETLLLEIENDLVGREMKDNLIVFLGDLIDRGPDSKSVIDKLLHYNPSFAQVFFIGGNHEDTLVRALRGDNHLLASWLRFGGLECAESYGVDGGILQSQPTHIIERVLLAAIPNSHLQFMENFYESIQFGDYLFVHAGLRPNVPLAQQSATDMKYIRSEFLESDFDFGCIVVHGHTITRDVDFRNNRIGIDTGAYATGVLTALRIEGRERSILQTKGPIDSRYNIFD